MKKILLGLTTTPGSDWRAKTREIDKLDIKEIALFPTYLEHKDRQELYSLLEKTGLKEIPLVHLREEDMNENEIEYLVARFKTKKFNIHPNIEKENKEKLEKYKDKIFIENSSLVDMLDIKKLEQLADFFAGLCIDFAHFEAALLQKDKSYVGFTELIDTKRIGFTHISAIREEPILYEWDDNHIPHYDLHLMDKLSQLDYLKKYIKYFQEINAIELENSFKEQLEIKKYIEDIIEGK